MISLKKFTSHLQDQTHIAAATSDRPPPCGCCQRVARSESDLALPVLQTPRAHAHASIHRPFFIAGILALLTAGAGWGGWLLWSVGQGASFTAPPISAINAHGHAQIYGWVGLFIMGFAFQSFPRMWRSPLPSRRLVMATLALLLVGLVIKTSAMYATDAGAVAARWALFGGGLEVTAVILFAGHILHMLERRKAPIAPSMAFIILAVMWLIFSTFGSVWHTWNLMTAESREALLHYVSTYQASLRDAQLHGVALFMILGVSARTFPTLFGLPVVSRKRSIVALFLLATAVAGEVALLIAMQWTMSHIIAGLLYVTWLMLAAGVVIMASVWKLWRPCPTTNPSAKFIRTAYAWLGASLLMLLLFPLHQVITGEPFSHAYYGAIRHAFTRRLHLHDDHGSRGTRGG